MPPQLPLELISHIIKLSLPRQSFSTFSERSTFLRIYALVSPSWRDVAQAELFASPVIDTEEAWDCFLRVLKEQSWRVEGVRSLRMRGIDGAGELLDVCVGVRNLWLCELPSSVPLAALLKPSFLTSLIVYDSLIEITASDLPFQLPHLTQLFLDALSSDAFAMALSRSSTPLLRAFGFHDSPDDNDGFVDLPDGMQSLVFQLDVLSFTFRDTIPETSLLADDKTLFDMGSDAFLRAFDFFGAQPRSAAPPRMKHVRLFHQVFQEWYDHASLQSFAELLDAGAANLGALRSVYVPAVLEGTSGAEHFEKALGIRGVQVAYEELPRWTEESWISPAFWRSHGGPRP